MVARRTPAAATKGPTMQTTTLSLPDDVHWKLRELALTERTTARALIREAIEQYLARRERRA